MHLADIMSHAGLAIYAEIALIIFLVVWLVATVRTFLRGNESDYEAARRLPFADEPRVPGAASAPSPRRGKE